MNIISDIQKVTAKGVKELYDIESPSGDILINETRKEFEGNYTVVCFPFTKTARKSPDQIGQDLGEFIKNNSTLVTDFNVVKGFLNLSVDDQFWIDFVEKQEIPTAKPTGKSIMVEYSSPNTNKPLHLGHIRNNLLGYAVAQIVEAGGNDVIKANLINDRGIHICKSMLAWQKFGNGETPESSGMKGDHLVGKYYVEFDKHYKAEIAELVEQGQSEEEAKKNAPILLETQEMLRKWEAKDPEVYQLWETMNGWVYAGMEVTYKNLGVEFDKMYYESNTYILGKDIIEEGLEKKVLFKKEDGSVWINLEDEGLDEKLLLRADGTSVYITQDIGTAQLKFEDYKMDRSVYVVGNEQEYHFKVLQLILSKLGKEYAPGIYHLSYGMVDLPSGKMKSREGTVVDADDLIQDMIDTAKAHTEELGKIDDFTTEEAEELYYTIGMGALKYYLLKVDPRKGILFNPEESIDFQGQTGPFIQYTHARIKSILRNADDFEVKDTYTELAQEEIDLATMIYKYKQVVSEASNKLDPAMIANFAFDIAKTYNKFYTNHSVLKEENTAAKQFRIDLCKMTAETIKQSMGLLGINVPERM